MIGRTDRVMIGRTDGRTDGRQTTPGRSIVDDADDATRVGLVRVGLVRVRDGDDDDGDGDGDGDETARAERRRERRERRAGVVNLGGVS
jgi:hypothetical protein